MPSLGAVMRMSSSDEGSSVARVRKPVCREHLRQEPYALGESVGGDDVWVCRGPAHPVEIAGEDLAQFRRAATVEVVEAFARDLVEHPPCRAHPCRSRKL
jgi:hypothetical protein